MAAAVALSAHHPRTARAKFCAVVADILKQGVGSSGRMNIPKLLQQAGEHLGAGEPEAADAVLNRILRKKPGHIDALNLAGVTAFQRRDFERAGKLLQRVVNKEPGRLSAHLNLGAVLNSLQQHEDAELHYRAVLRAEPANANALCNLGKNYLDQNKLVEAQECLQAAVAADSTYWIARHNLGTCLQRLGAIDAAIEAYREALELHDNPESLSELIATLRRTDRFEEEYRLAQRLLAMPNAGDVAISAWETLFDAFDWDAIEQTRTRILGLLEAADSRAECRGSGLILLNSLAEVGAAQAFYCHRAWARSLPAQPAPKPAPPAASIDLARLKVGYLSPDFREHSVGFFIRHVIAAHDREHFEVFCYANSTQRDAVTDEVIGAAAHYSEVTQLSDAELAARISADQLDILIDLAGHTRDSRLAVMSRRLATVQMSYLGYPNTSGLDTIDYRITDPHADDAEGTQYSETLLDLPESFLCFGRFDEVERRPDTPAGHSGYITFGCFNNLRKVTPAAIAAWSEILTAVPDSRLVIKSRRGGETITRRHLYAMFADFGIDPGRVDTRPALTDRRDHLAAYNDIDIALDTFPYHGTTTTCEALWMGVPVVTLAGAAHAQRVSYSILANLELSELVTWSTGDYIAKGIELSRDFDRLSRLRSDIPVRLERSILCDAPRFTRQFEKVLMDAVDLHNGKITPAAIAG